MTVMSSGLKWTFACFQHPVSPLWSQQAGILRSRSRLYSPDLCKHTLRIPQVTSDLHILRANTSKCLKLINPCGQDLVFCLFFLLGAREFSVLPKNSSVPPSFSSSCPFFVTSSPSLPPLHFKAHNSSFPAVDTPSFLSELSERSRDFHV